MKKLLSFVLAVIMLLSVMPVAYAKLATYSPEMEQYIKDYKKINAYLSDVYETPEQKSEASNIIHKAIGETSDPGVGYEYTEEFAAFHKCLKKGIDEVEKKIADGEIVIVIDTYEYWDMFLNFAGGFLHQSAEEQKELMDRVEKFNSEKYINAKSEADIGAEILSKMEGDITQAEFDAAMEKMKPLYNLYVACLDGNHPYGEYISDNNATEEADGTKTATCEFCGATDTILDEGTKLPKEEAASFFEMLFDLIKDFIDIIFSLFK